MKKRIIVVILLLPLLLAGCSDQVQTNLNNSTPIVSNTVEHQVIIEDYSFNPQEITIKTGDTVTWINGDQVKRTVTSWYEWSDEDDVWNTSIGQEWSSGDIETGEKYSRQFNQAGDFHYLSLPLYFILLNLHQLNPSMQGRVFVTHQ